MTQNETSTVFLDLASAASNVGYSVVADALGLAVRPLTLVYAASPVELPMVNSVLHGGLLYGLISSVSFGLLMVSFGALGCNCMFRAAGAAFAADGLAQLPILAWPPLTEHWSYPMSLTGLFATTVQLSVCLPFALFGDTSIYGCLCMPDLDERVRLLSFAIPLRFVAFMLVQRSAVAFWALYGTSLLLGLFVVTPRAVWKLMGQCVYNAGEAAVRACSVVYSTLVYLWPKIRELVRSIFQHPLLIGLYRALIVPVWERLSPWVLPVGVLGVVCSCSLSLVRGEHILRSGDPVVVLDGLTRLVGTASAAVSLFILTLHTVSQRCCTNRHAMPDPLSSSALTSFLDLWARAISFPWWLISVMWRPFWGYVSTILTPVCNLLLRLCSCACSSPIIVIPGVLLFNILLLSYLANILEAAAMLVSPVTAVLPTNSWRDLQAAIAGGGSPTDSMLAVVLIMAVQIGAYYTMASVLKSVRAIRSVRNTAHALSLEELNLMAGAMGDPRQCARCGFGPVDHSGCSNLQTHHMEIVVGGGGAQVSNECPRCSWFTGRLQDWPPWDGELQTAQGRAVFRQRVWGEVFLVTRASSKALLVPYLLLLLGSFLHLPPSLSAFLAFSYLVPWIAENWCLAESINNPRSFAARQRQTADLPAGVAVGGAADCGAARPDAVMLPPITQSQALQNILTSHPSCVFLEEGDVCSVCLEGFSGAAVGVVADSGKDSPMKELCLSRLQGLDPPIVALRCGHPLHVECAEAAVAAAGARHVRCPLCREPVTLSGDIGAAMFS